MIFYANRLIPEILAACTRGQFIFIRPEHQHDDRMPLFARYIANDYGLRISESDALELLKE